MDDSGGAEIHARLSGDATKKKFKYAKLHSKLIKRRN